MKKTMTLPIPIGLMMLCDLLDTTPEALLKGFIHDLSRTPQSKGPDERILAGEYFLRCGYGMACFTYDQVEEMLRELNTMRYDCYQFTKGQEAEYQKHLRKRLNQWNDKWKEVKKVQSPKDEGR